MRDLHLHLSGATSIPVLWELVCESGIKTKAKTYWEFEKSVLMGNSKVKDLDSYLDILHAIDRVQSSPNAIEMSVYDAFRSSYLSGTSYLELRFNPTKRSQNGAIDLDKIIISARAGMERAKINYGIEGKLILCLGRDCSEKANEAVIDKAIQYNGKGIYGIDLAGPYTVDWKDQKDFFKWAYKTANKCGLMTTAHAGEENHKDVEEELRWTIHDLKVKRIGHGIQIYQFKELMIAASLRKIIFEICPTSNLTTGVVQDSQDLSNMLIEMISNNLDLQVGTDSTHLLRTTAKIQEEILKSLLE